MSWFREGGGVQTSRTSRAGKGGNNCVFIIPLTPGPGNCVHGLWQRYPKWFYYYWTKHHLDEFQRIAAGKVTTMGHIQRHHLSEAFIVISPERLLRCMTETFAPLLDAIISNRLESRALTERRDALLPKLISGGLRVPEASRFAGKAC
jgi:type I restriction enzyme S subunit